MFFFFSLDRLHRLGWISAVFSLALLLPAPAGAQHTEADSKTGSAKCLECHDLKDQKFQKPHGNMLTAATNCLSCHDPAQKQDPKRLRAFQHAPFATGNCALCHAPSTDGKVAINRPSTRALCLSCHDDKAHEIESAKVHHPGAEGECTSCHTPHASDKPALLKSGSVDSCLTCHSDMEELKKKSVHHQPAFAEGCSTCHTAHGGDEVHLLRARGNALCTECHSADARPTPLPGRHMTAIFDGKVKLPEDYFERNKVPVLKLTDGRGHPVPGHPVSDVPDPADPTKVKASLSCLSCHQPHASTQPGLLIGDQSKGQAFCSTCHKQVPGQPATNH
jgi:predicted CXXCH cytochrome family protein